MSNHISTSTQPVSYSPELKTIIAELSAYYQNIDAASMDAMADQIIHAKRIFIAGAGRSGFAAKAFANRLMHLGLTVYFAGETVTPAIAKGDLLLIGSGSGTTGSLVAMAGKAKHIGASIATITIFPENTIGQMSDAVIAIPGATPKSGAADTAVSVQPMGSLFEQLSWLTYDALVMILQKKLGQTSDEMFARHANLE